MNYDIKNMHLIGLYEFGAGLKNYFPIIPFSKNEMNNINKVNYIRKRFSN